MALLSFSRQEFAWHAYAKRFGYARQPSGSCYSCPLGPAANINYNEIYSEVIKSTIFNILLALAAKYDWEVNLVNIVTAFLYVDVKERIYMKQLTDFVEDLNKMCLLLKTLYNLKQSPRKWYKTLSEFLLSLDFIRSQFDAYLFLYKTN